MAKNSTWVCIQCGRSLGILLGQEYKPADDVTVQTQGANLVVRCPDCNQTKVWYPADPLLRVLTQFIDVIATETAKAATRAVGSEMSHLIQLLKIAIGESDDKHV